MNIGVTGIYVNDQDEALVMSDRIAVMNQGVIEQVGAPEELYERPRTRFVADFLAVRNILEGIKSNKVKLDIARRVTGLLAEGSGVRTLASRTSGSWSRSSTPDPS